MRFVSTLSELVSNIADKVIISADVKITGANLKDKQNAQIRTKVQKSVTSDFQINKEMQTKIRRIRYG